MQNINKKAKEYINILLGFPVIGQLKEMEDLGVSVTTHTYDVLEIAIRDLKKSYRNLKRAGEELDLFAMLVGIIIHDTSKASLRAGGDSILSHSQVMLKKPDRIRKEATGILKKMEEETGLVLDANTERKIVHIVLSHHGRWGRVTPSTKEALMVHKADEYSAKYHRINPIGADKIVELMAKGHSLDDIKEKLDCTSGIIKDRLKRAKVELKLKTNKQLLSYYNANKKIVIGDEFFIKRITETEELIRKVDKIGFETLVKQCELFNHFNDNQIFDRGL
ncbi:MULTISPECIES: HD domain-containing protein [Psychrilyobacter]|uniref:HD domain-containing protein n=1 Tax=Psychrilyobacter piezotolerans TaxID=2293438 RepID=A0ABX9KL90_9FUSO|nr:MULTISPECIES: HD domain-containing protein [Psychrilyobacter]MCS5422604.1 HD domain-containing protein [Psychrilyobacter sp. S5]NDI76550.1 HD domain-containing protein [Psychrilyobacter piezotolerans]RDE66141.1 HD domain-containing protein [Psychrilyobacter sp. S5]REI43319.1 HD domain-containing protein [Psychrilyobacter piezotolerans]